MSNCKLGDLAFIKKSMRPKNIGLVVSCHELLGYHLQCDIIELYGERWMAPISDTYWVIQSGSGSIDTEYGNSKIAYIPDSWLSPIKAEPLEDDVFTSEELTDNISA